MVLIVLAGVLALVGWLAFGGGGNGTKNVVGRGTGPAQSITPGPTGSGGGSSDGSPSGRPSGSPSKGAGSGGAAGGSGPVSVSSGSGSSGSGGAAGSSGPGAPGTGSGGSVAAGGAGTMQLPVCLAADLELSLNSTQPSYGASQWPLFQLQISNTGSAACRTDLGADSAVVQVSTSGNAHVWSSADCPVSTASQWYAVPGSGGSVTADFQWGRTTSAHGCTPGAGGVAAAPGTYVVQISLKGVTGVPLSHFTLAPFGS